jgi:Domain of unknown function (DUF4082)/Bacterial Ig-like domain (group 3)/Bacterial Ig domain
MAVHLRRISAVGRRSLLLLVAVVASSGALFPIRPAAAVDPCSFANVNPIPCENAQPGTPQSVWSVGGAGDPGIQGFATDISVNVGGTISFKISTSSTTYGLTIYRLGYYQNNGARQVATVQPSAALPQQQPACLTDAPTGLVDCGNWAVSASWTVPATAVSGLYFARVADTTTGAASQIWFVVRSDSSTSDVLFRTNDTTWEAYNDYGGNSVYYGSAPSSNGRAYKVSYNRPFHNRSEGVGFGTANGPLYAEYPMIKWLESNGYNVSYTSSIDTERSPALLKQHKVFLTSGHDEYWSAGERSAVLAARDAGVDMAFFTGNEDFWKIRWESSIDGSGTPYRTLVTYKESLDQRVLDPQDPPTWTGSWRDPRWSPPADGGQPENAVGGTIFTVDRGSAAPVISSDFANLRFWRNTAIASLTAGQTVTLGSNTIGYEWDEDLDNGSRPAGLFDLSSTTVNVPLKLRDYGVNYQPGTATHSLTMYRAASGALVFSAGTVQWAWGLDVLGHDTGPDFGPNVPDRNMQQATVNLLADMGAQPTTLQSPLVAATASTDATPPTSAITAPAAGATVASGSPVTIGGTASDVGGAVAGVEVSVDGGATWHKASGTTTWTYAWTPQAPGPTVLKSRAVDDSANLETPPAGVTVTVTPPACPCRLFPTTDVPGTPNSQDSNQVEVGVRFTPEAPGSVIGVSFYKGSSNTGSHIGSLWTSTGTLLATGTFANETASGWQTLTFATPVAVQPSTVYVASYHTTSGFYSSDAGFYTSPVDSWPLHAPAGFNGVFAYGGTQFPTQTFSSNNYWVDVLFDPATTSTALTSSANPSVFGQPVTLTATVTPSISGGAPPAGSVAFLDGTAQVGAGTLNGQSPDVATLTTSALAAGGHSLTAVYAGGGGYLGSTSAALGQQVNQAATGTSLTASPSPATYGSTVTLSAAVAPVAPGAGTPTGTVAFFDGTAQLGTAALAAGHASLSTAGLSGGTHALKAVYQGDGNFTGSTSATVSEVVQPAATKLAAAPAVLGLDPLQLTLLNLSATLTRSDTGAPIAGQTVAMTAGGTFLCSATTNAAGVATCNGVLGVLAILLGGGYTATFNGTPNYRASSAFGPAIS